MTRAAEFCYIAEQQPTESDIVAKVRYVRMDAQGVIVGWTWDNDEALRISADGQMIIAKAVAERHKGMSVGFRKILVG